MRERALVILAVLFWVSLSQADLSNDMFFHHHPELINADLNTHFAKPNNRMAQADTKSSLFGEQSFNQENNGFRQYNRGPAKSEQYHGFGQQNDNYDNGYYSSPEPDQGNSYSDYSHAKSNYYNTFARNSAKNDGNDAYYENGRSNNQASHENNQYNAYPPSSPRTVNKIVYNDDGSINWDKSKSEAGKVNNRNQAQQMDSKYSQDHDNQYDEGETVPMGIDSPSFARGIRLAGALPDDGYHRGVGTYYDLETRVSSCGKQNKNTELVAALNSQQMGKKAGRGNPNCGKQIEVTGPSGKSVHVAIVDECKTCSNGGLDLSPAAFEEIGDFSHGSIPIKWKFIDQ